MSDQALNRSLDDFLRRHQNEAYAIALVSVKQPADALDVVQEAMLSFVKSYHRKPNNHWRPLFFRVLQNKINDHHRRQKSWLRHFFKGHDSADLAADQASEQPSPLAVLSTQDQGNELIAAIQDLPSQQQQVILYRHWQELSVQETAEVMQISPGSVKTHLFRATQKIKSLLGENHVQRTHQ